jgi:hypothetical protein
VDARIEEVKQAEKEKYQDRISALEADIASMIGKM